MSICNECWGKGWIEKQGVQFDCRKCKGTGVIENEPQTNEEWRKTCSTEEFAEWITDKINAKLRMALNDAYLYDGDVDEKEYMEKEDEWLEWLKEIHDA